MPRQYDSFFVRHWRLDGEGDRRTEVVHVQSGERTPFASLPQAVAWLDIHTVAPPSGGDLAAEHPARDRQPGDAAG